MDFYRPYYIKVRTEDEAKVVDILEEHDAKGDLDNWSFGWTDVDEEGNRWVEIRIAPIIYEDLETIKNEFRQAGIRMM